jgi:hypothetical protein
VSVSNAGVQGIAATPIDISDDGCRVVFEAASIVSPAPSSGNAAVLRDRCQGATSRLDLSSAGDPGAGNVSEVAISPGTGRYVAFVTSSAGLVGADGNSLSDVFVRDLATNVAPVAALSVSVSGLTVTADASASTDPDGYGASATISYGDGSPAQNGLRGTHAFPRAGTYGVSVTVTDSDGVSSSKTVAVTVTDAPAAGGPGGLPLPIGRSQPTPPDSAAKLVLDRLSLSPARFAVVGKGKKPDSRHGGELTLRLSAPATVTLRFQRARTGRKVKGRCRPSVRKGAKCTVYSDAGTITKKLGAGTSTIVLTGRIGSRTLATAKHRLTVSARGADGQTTSARTLTLTIVKATNKKKGK